MLAFLTARATTMTMALFAVSAVTGVMMFFHILTPFVKDMHEWLSFILLAPIAFHVWRNRRPIYGYLKRRELIAPSAIAAVAVAGFLVPATMAPTKGGDPSRRLLTAMGEARVADIAPLVKRTPEELAAALASAGLSGAATDRTLGEIARASDKSQKDALRILGGLLPAGARK